VKLTKLLYPFFSLYPTSFPETGCITIMRAMGCGVIPITSRLRNSVLPTLTAGFDLGPSQQLNFERNQVYVSNVGIAEEDKPSVADSATHFSDWLESHWLPAVLEAIRADPQDLQERRARMQSSTRAKFSWVRSARIMLQAMLTMNEK
jgi:protein O-GlcNAc transferase